MAAVDGFHKTYIPHLFCWVCGLTLTIVLGVCWIQTSLVSICRFVNTLKPPCAPFILERGHRQIDAR
eukprot:5113916-Amphidinium_carterae.1